MNGLRSHVVGPYGELLQFVGTKRRCNRNVGRISAPRNQHTPGAADVVSRVKRVPTPADIGFEPRGEIHRRVWRWHSHVAQIPRAIPGGNVHAPAESDGQMSKI